jgi:RNA polymerase sigma factor for flagellar operon FliA
MSAVVFQPQEQDEIWGLYKRTKDLRLRDRLILKYSPLVKYVAGRLAMGLPAHVDVEDLVSYGVFGLIDAIEKFDPGRQVKFQTYAIARIRGAMLDSLRAFDWIPYSVRQKAKELERTYTRVEAKLGRSATDAEIADELGITLAQFDRLLREVRGIALVSLDEVWNGDDESGNGLRPVEVIEDESSEDPLKFVEFEDMKRVLAEAIEKLPERERMIVNLYYHQGLTAKEISRIMGVSQSRISQLHSKAVTRLRSRLTRLLGMS